MKKDLLSQDQKRLRLASPLCFSVWSRFSCCSNLCKKWAFWNALKNRLFLGVRAVFLLFFGENLFSLPWHNDIAVRRWIGCRRHQHAILCRPPSVASTRMKKTKNRASSTCKLCCIRMRRLHSSVRTVLFVHSSGLRQPGRYTFLP